MKPRVSLREALSDPSLLGTAIAGPSRLAWRVLLIAAMGEELTTDERILFKQLTGREREPLQRVEEFEAVVGRRGGKTSGIAAMATYIATCCDHPELVAGERGVLLVVAPDQRQSQICLDYIEAAIDASPILRQLIEQRTQWSLRLSNRIDIEVRASDFRRLRGPTFICVIADESAFWFNENSANPDTEILNAVRPGLATTGGPLFMISSPYARRGELWRTYQKHFGANGDPLILVAQGSSRTFNPTLSQSVVDRAMERDPASAAAEFGAEFRRDIESFVSIEAVQAVLSANVFERAPQRGIAYVGFVDPSGGSADAFTLAIAHVAHNRETTVIDCLREVRPPFSPEAVVAEFAQTLKSYRLTTVTGDRYAAEWPVEQFSKYGILYVAAEKPKSELYADLLATINSRRCDLLDHPKLTNQLVGLERRTARGGKDSIDHSPGGHDDIANAVAGAVSICITRGIYNPNFMNDASSDDPGGRDAWRRARLSWYLNSGGKPPPF